MGGGVLATFVKNLLGSAGPGKESGVRRETNAICVYLKCGKCGEPVALRLRKTDEIQRNFEKETYPNCAYYVNKMVVDRNSGCTNRMEVHIEFDESFHVISKTIVKGKGEFISPSEYDAMQSAGESE